MTKLAVFEATAKQMPCAPMITAVLMPITSPREETSAPPELPGLSAASVWMTSSISRPFLAAQRAAERRDDAGRDGRLEAERVADGDRDLAAPERLRVAEPRPGQVDGLLDMDEREVGVGIIADQPRVEACARPAWRRRRGRALRDMAVREDEAVGRQDDTGARAARLAALEDVELDDGGADKVDDARDGIGIGVEQRRLGRAATAASGGGTDEASSSRTNEGVMSSIGRPTGWVSRIWGLAARL